MISGQPLFTQEWLSKSETNLETIRGGTALCGRLIRRTIETGCNINWNALVLGA
jgi:hypothetical protein